MRRSVLVAGPAVLLGAAGVAMVLALVFGGGADAPAVLDPGALVRWGLPAFKELVDLSVGITVGAILLALFALSPKEREYGRAMDVAAATAAIWAVSSAVEAIFTYWSTTITAPSASASYGEGLGDYLTTTAEGQAWLVMTLAGAAITAMCFAIRNQTAVLLIAAVGVGAIIRLSNEGHAGDSSTHDVATTAIFLHVLFAGLWFGGLLTLVLLKPTLERGRLAIVLARYSTLALIAFVVVAASGYVSAAVRVGTLPNLLTPYGVLVLIKVAALLALGMFGAVQRRVMIGRLGASTGSRFFWIMVTAELAFMGIAAGVASALAVTAPPVVAVSAASVANASPAQRLTGKPLPDPLTAERWLTSWSLDLLWVLVVAFGIFFYWAGVRRLRRRGDRWPLYRPILWTIGMLVLLWVTNGAPAVYEQYLFSMHMTLHMTLSMAIPVFLVLGAPVTLAARAIKKRDDGSRGAREWIMLTVHSRVAGVLTNPLVAAALFAGSLWVFYYTPLFRWATEDHLGHYWMTVHFLIVGYLFVQALIGIDPVKWRAPYPLRLIILLATMAMHAFFGLTIISSTGLFLADWYGAMGRTWGATPLADQQAAGGIAWSIGEIPTVTLAIVVAILWSRSDAREAKRRDRAADQYGDVDLEAYNAMLAERASSGSAR